MTAIEWADRVWNPVTGCDRVSEGCENCYALAYAGRLKAMGQAKYQNDGNDRTSGPGFGVTVHPDEFDAPLRWRKGVRVFVNSMADLFHQAVSDEVLADLFAVMAAAERHTFMVLTKRHARMASLLGNRTWTEQVRDRLAAKHGETRWQWPLPNVWMGVSVENQRWADLRVPALVATPAAVKFLSAEPLLGPIDLHQALIPCGDPRGTGLTMSFVHNGTCCEHGLHGIGWIIAGGESGAGHRPVEAEWIRALRDQAAAASVPFFFKQWGGFTPKRGGRVLDGRTWDQLPVTASQR